MPRNHLSFKTLPNTGYNNIPRIEIIPLGNWDGVMRKLSRMGPDVLESSIKAQEKVARTIVKKVKQHLRNQDLNWKPLSAHYLQTKENWGLDSRTLMATHSYYDAIDFFQGSRKSIVYAGVRKGLRATSLDGRTRKIDIAQVAAIHEFGGGKLPKRPLWNPTIHEIGGAKGIQEMFLGSFLYYIRMKGLPVKRFRNLWD